MAERRQKGTGSVWKDKNKNIYHGEMQIGYLPNGNKKMPKDKAKEIAEKYMETTQITSTMPT